MTTSAISYPRCPKCGGAMTTKFICYAVDYVHCTSCDFDEFLEFKTRQPAMKESSFNQQAIPKTTRRFNHA